MFSTQGGEAIKSGILGENNINSFLLNEMSIKEISDANKIPECCKRKNTTRFFISNEVLNFKIDLEDGSYIFNILAKKQYKKFNYEIILKNKDIIRKEFDNIIFIIKNKQIIKIIACEFKNNNVSGSDFEKISYMADVIYDNRLNFSFLVIYNKIKTSDKEKEINRLREVERFKNFYFTINKEEEKESIYKYIHE